VGAALAAGRLAGSRLQRVQWWQQGLRALCANSEHQILSSALLTHLHLAMHCVHVFEGLGIDQYGCCQCQTMHCLRRCSALCHCPLTPLCRVGQVPWEKVVGGAQDVNVSLRMLYGDEQWVLRSVREFAPVRLWIENQAKSKTQGECVPWTAH
jgi:hypothetical protein